MKAHEYYDLVRRSRVTARVTASVMQRQNSLTSRTNRKSPKGAAAAATSQCQSQTWNHCCPFFTSSSVSSSSSLSKGRSSATRISRFERGNIRLSLHFRTYDAVTSNNRDDNSRIDVRNLHNGNGTKKEHDEDKEKRNETMSHSLSLSLSSDPYHRYKRYNAIHFPPQTQQELDIILELRKETAWTELIIDNSLAKLHITRKEIRNEIQRASMVLSKEINSIPELGPTGLWEYYSTDDHHYIDNNVNKQNESGTDANDGVFRTYRRRKRKDFVGTNTSITNDALKRHCHYQQQQEQQVVLQFDFSTNQQPVAHIMSLSVDEEYIAYLIKTPPSAIHDSSSSFSSRPSTDSDKQDVTHDFNTSKTARAHIVVRHIPTGEEHVVPQHQVTTADIQNVEFGPAHNEVDYCKNKHKYSNNKPRYHELYFTTSNEIHRPDMVYLVLFDSTTKTFTTPQCVYHDTDERNFVDISRTKGCYYVAIHSTSKTSNEIHLVQSSMEMNMGTINEAKCKSILIRKRQQGIQYYVDVGNNGDIFVLAHRTAPISNESSNSIGNCDKEDVCSETAKSVLLGEEMSVFQMNIKDLPLQHGSFVNLIHVSPASSSCSIVGEGEQISWPSYSNKSSSSSSSSDLFVIEEMDLFEKFLALYERSSVDGRQRIRVLDRRRQSGRDDSVIVPIPQQDQHLVEEGGIWQTISPGGNICYASTKIRFVVESPLSPGVTYEYDAVSGEVQRVLSVLVEDGSSNSRMKKNERGDSCVQTDILIGAYPKKYVMRRVLIPSKDGTRVPLTLLYAKDPHELVENGPKTRSAWAEANNKKRPTVLLGYGSYGLSQNPTYDPTLTPLLDRGFAIAYAHTRGGGDLGRSWHIAGRTHGKERCVEDYISCAEAIKDPAVLLDDADIDWGGYHGASALVAKSYSAGGVVVGAAVNSCPTLFDVAVLTNPFMDVTTAMMDPTLPLTEHEWDEWGNPLVNEETTRCIERFCPVANVRHQTYPKMLLVGTLDDENVPFWHTVVFAKKVRDCAQLHKHEGGANRDTNSATGESETNEANWINHDDQGIYIHIEEQGGHHLNGKKLDVASAEVSFILGQLNMKLVDTDISRPDDTKHDSFLNTFRAFWS